MNLQRKRSDRRTQPNVFGYDFLLNLHWSQKQQKRSSKRVIFVWRLKTFMSMCNVAGEKCPKVADNFFIIVNKNCPKVAGKLQTTTAFSNVNKNCLQDIFCVCDYVAASRCFCYGGHENVNDIEICNNSRKIFSNLEWFSWAWFKFGTWIRTLFSPMKFKQDSE